MNECSNKKRNSSIELLRIVIIMLIIADHFEYYGSFCFNETLTIEKLWCKSILEMGGHLGVVVFVIISGYFLISKENIVIDWKKILKLLGEIYFYSISFFILSLIFNKNISNSDIINAFLPIGRESWWFASTYFVLLLMHPYLNKLLISLSKQQYKELLVLLVVIWSLIPKIIVNYQLSHLIEFVMYYTIAGYIKLYGLFPNANSNKWFIAFITLTFIKLFLYVMPEFIHFRYDLISECLYHVYDRNTIFTIIQAICLFMAFLNLDIKYNPFINKIASTTFGVYLIHDSNLLKPNLYIDLSKIEIYQNAFMIIPYSIVATLTVFICCSMIDLIRQCTIEKLFSVFVQPLSTVIGKTFNTVVNFISNHVLKDD